MSILFTTFVAVGLILGWFRDLSSEVFGQVFMFWSCILTSLVFGLFVELLVSRWRFKVSGLRGWRAGLQHVAVNWLVAFGVGTIALALLASHLFDASRSTAAVIVVIVIEFVVVCSVAALIDSRRLDQPGWTPLFRGFGNYALMNTVSMLVGVSAGRMYLNVFYPGVG
jgi:hypothetical protein